MRKIFPILMAFACVICIYALAILGIIYLTNLDWLPKEKIVFYAKVASGIGVMSSIVSYVTWSRLPNPSDEDC